MDALRDSTTTSPTTTLYLCCTTTYKAWCNIGLEMHPPSSFATILLHILLHIQGPIQCLTSMFCSVILLQMVASRQDLPTMKGNTYAT